MSRSAAASWKRLVRARLAETARLSAAGAPDTTGFWDSRARRYASRFGTPDRRDPFVARVRRVVGPTSTVVDVGAGPGRFSLALASRAREVIAVEPSGRMLGHLRRQSRRLHIENVRCLQGRWEDVDAPPADVVICSYVLPLIEDVGGFLAKMDATAKDRAFLYLSAMSVEALFDPFWRHFHGAPRRPGPTYLDAVAVLEELGLAPEVEVVEVPVRTTFASLGAAVDEYRENLFLADTADVRRQLRSLLRPWLTEREGTFRPPLRSMPAAVVGWRPRQRHMDARRRPA